ncbi:hypothetical protein HMPREF0971_01114, partial [Segatella oris F0302]
VCRVARGKRCKMGRMGDFSQAPDFGFCASQNMYYFGYKLNALCGLSGVIPMTCQRPACMTSII